MTSPRDDLVDAVTKAIGSADVHVIPYQDNTDQLDRITVMFKQLSLSPLKEAPRGAYRLDYVLTVVSPATDPAVAEKQLDEFVPSMLGDLDGLDWFAYDIAEKVTFQSAAMAYDVRCYIIARKVTDQ